MRLDVMKELFAWLVDPCYLGAVIFTWMQLVLVSHVDKLLAGGIPWQGCLGICYMCPLSYRENGIF